MTFEKRYYSLNEKQKEAVDAIFGPVLVIAGPGSGKTELLAVRIANILQKTDALASNILCLTFTDNAAKNMRERLAKIIGPDAYKVAIHTFHTFGMEILQKYQYKLREEDELTVIDDVAKSQIFSQIRAGLSWDHPWRSPRTARTVSQAIDELKKAGISPEDFRAILEINEQILNDIWPKIENSFEKILLLWQKKAEKEKKMQLFWELLDDILPALNSFPSNYNFQPTLADTWQKSMEEVWKSGDTKMLTKWKNSHLEKITKQKIALKDRKKYEKSLGLLEIYKAYSRELASLSLVDFSDMILRAITILESDENIRATVAEQYQWILVDEYQDTNDAQLKLVNLVASMSDVPNIFAVGDDDQSIYKFQGANTKNIRLFHDLYEGTQLIILEKNYRSFSEIIETSRWVLSQKSAISEIFPDTQKCFQAHRGEGGEVYFYSFENELAELAFVAEEIEKIIQKNRDNPDFRLSEIAVIAKKNSTLEMIGKLLMSKNIAAELSREQSIFSDPAIDLVVKILLYISSLSTNNHRDDLLFEILSHPAFSVHRLTLWEVSQKIFSSKKRENKVWIEILRRHSDPMIKKIATFLMEVFLLSQNTRLEKIIDIVIGSNSLQLSEEYDDENIAREQFSLPVDSERRESFISPIYAYFFSEEKLWERPLAYQITLANVRKFIDSLRSYKKQKPQLTLLDFTEYMALLREYSVDISTSTLISRADGIQCITAHKSKGLEYTYVFAIGLTESKYARKKYDENPFMSNFDLSPEKDNTEDIERLIYTVFTRAKEVLFATYSQKNLDEKPESVVSVLSHIEEWDRNEIKNLDNCSKILEQKTQSITDIPFDGDEWMFLQHLVSSQLKISATAIQNFLNVAEAGPAHYLTNNVLRFPQAKSPSAIYGTAMHKALEDFFRDYKHKKTFQKSILQESFQKTLTAEGLDEAEEKMLLDRGFSRLEALYPELVRDYGELYLEYRFNFEGSGVYLGDIRLSGAIDRVEVTPDKKLLVTDYKTGVGFPSLDSPGVGAHDKIKQWKYHLQLIFYALIFQESPRWNIFSEKKFELFFIEPDKKTGEYYHVEAYPQQSEIDRLKKLIMIIVDHIKRLDFPDVSAYPKTVEGNRQFEEDLLNGNI